MAGPIHILIASNNAHKHREVAEILALNNVSALLIKPADFGISIDPEENADTYLGNAQIKARAFRAALIKLTPAANDHPTELAQKARKMGEVSPNIFVLADDSGLEVDALGGRPGLLSARYARMSPGSDGCAAILGELLRCAGSQRTARFKAVIVVITPTGDEHCEAGVCEGAIGHERRGMNGFGYDPIFRPAGCIQHLAELSNREKHGISHRGLALSRLCPRLVHSKDV